jgi:hypothetical protein
MRPQSFSLLGALKMASKVEEKLLVFYKKMSKEKLLAERDIFKRLAKETSLHLKELQKEMSFTQDKELFASMDLSEQATWLKKVFE